MGLKAYASKYNLFKRPPGMEMKTGKHFEIFLPKKLINFRHNSKESGGIKSKSSVGICE
jgi:hypothetical protein